MRFPCASRAKDILDLKENGSAQLQTVLCWQTGPHLKVSLDPTISFTLKGKSFERRKQDFVKTMHGVDPSRIQKYSAVVGGKRFPIRLVLATVTGLPAIVIPSQDAYRVLDKFGFAVDSSE